MRIVFQILSLIVLLSLSPETSSACSGLKSEPACGVSSCANSIAKLKRLNHPSSSSSSSSSISSSSKIVGHRPFCPRAGTFEATPIPILMQILSFLKKEDRLSANANHHFHQVVSESILKGENPSLFWKYGPENPVDAYFYEDNINESYCFFTRQLKLYSNKKRMNIHPPRRDNLPVNSKGIQLPLEQFDKMEPGSVGALFLNGAGNYLRGIQPNPSLKLLRWNLLRQAKSGCPRAQDFLGLLYINGIGVPRNMELAAYYSNQAKEKDPNALSAKKLEYLQLKSQLVPALSEEELLRIQYEIAKNEFAAMEEVMDTAYRFREASRYAEAANLFSIAVAQGNTDAKVDLGVLYLRGDGVVQDVSKAFALFRKAADEGDVFAKLNLGLAYERGEGVGQDISKAVTLYTEAADRGNAKAKFYLGLLYKKGKGVDQDIKRSFDFFSEAAAQGYTIAKTNLGFFYDQGEGVAKNLSKAFDLYREAADEGDIFAKINLGICYEEGKGVAQNLFKAFDLYSEAADKGNILAKAYLGRCYEKGKGVAQNLFKAFELYSEAANQGNEYARNRLQILQDKQDLEK